jgi:hypothetical protein
MEHVRCIYVYTQPSYLHQSSLVSTASFICTHRSPPALWPHPWEGLTCYFRMSMVVLFPSWPLPTVVALPCATSHVINRDDACAVCSGMIFVAHVCLLCVRCIPKTTLNMCAWHTFRLAHEAAIAITRAFSRHFGEYPLCECLYTVHRNSALYLHTRDNSYSRDPSSWALGRETTRSFTFPTLPFVSVWSQVVKSVGNWRWNFQNVLKHRFRSIVSSRVFQRSLDSRGPRFIYTYNDKYIDTFAHTNAWWMLAILRVMLCECVCYSVCMHASMHVCMYVRMYMNTYHSQHTHIPSLLGLYTLLSLSSDCQSASTSTHSSTCSALRREDSAHGVTGTCLYV